MVDANTLVEQAQALMRRALELLDEAGERIAAPHLSAAIDHLDRRLSGAQAAPKSSVPPSDTGGDGRLRSA